MRGRFLFGIGLLAFAAAGAGSAVAADLPVKAVPPPPPVAVPLVPTWTGFYLGFNGGWGWSSFDTTVTQLTPDGNFDFIPQSFSTRVSGPVFGGQLGYNWQIANWVLGIEGDFDGAGISGAQGVTTPSLLAPTIGLTGVDGFAAADKINWLASIRGRIGVLWGPGLFYFTGGGAWEDVERSLQASANTGVGIIGQTVFGQFSSTRSGFVVGGGYEWMITPRWIARAEYLFYDFNTTNTDVLTLPNCRVSGTCNVAFVTGSNNVNVVRLGLSYKF
jgi:outer membrane immunogenic protein